MNRVDREDDQLEGRGNDADVLAYMNSAVTDLSNVV